MMTGGSNELQLTVEISMYPARADFAQPIEAFIAQLVRQPDLDVETTTTSTRVVGAYARVMAVLEEAMAVSYRDYGTAVFVAKLIPGYDARVASAGPDPT